MFCIVELHDGRAITISDTVMNLCGEMCYTVYVG